MSYETFLSITLTATTVVLAVLALLIALLALWGYKAIKEEARSIAEEAAKTKIAEYLDGEQIQSKLKQEISMRVTAEADQLFADMSLSFAYPERREENAPGEKIGEPYPKKAE